ncbi:SgcJ/EcaC family oxidoreductase [Streptomyces sp. NPDC057301]|uniref:SgcJ/EcaC family oxidoreductase n=1 Tax=Streptomyces sp. NPDC057301 TaxID=3346093 RepID=UPI003635BACF
MRSSGHPDASAVVLMDGGALSSFLDAAIAVYGRITPKHPLPCFALLLGSVDADAIHIKDVTFARNARTRDPVALREFTDTIVPRYGTAYENESRGWWADSHDLLCAAREAERRGLELLGSIHMHPDWHRIGPPHERSMILGAHPTPMDTHMFTSTGWPVNIICYVERHGGAMYHKLAAWAPFEPGQDRHFPCRELSLRVSTARHVRPAGRSCRSADAGGSVMTDPDESVTQLWTALSEAWARGDAHDFAANFHPQCDFTSVRGDKPEGRAGIADSHAKLFAGVYRGSSLDAHVRRIRHLSPGIATVDVESSVIGPDGSPLAHTHALAVVQHDTETDRWSITSFHNMVPVGSRPHPQPDPLSPEERTS